MQSIVLFGEYILTQHLPQLLLNMVSHRDSSTLAEREIKDTINDYKKYVKEKKRNSNDKEMSILLDEKYSHLYGADASRILFNYLYDPYGDPNQRLIGTEEYREKDPHDYSGPSFKLSDYYTVGPSYQADLEKVAKGWSQNPQQELYHQPIVNTYTGKEEPSVAQRNCTVSAQQKPVVRRDYARLERQKARQKVRQMSECL